MALRKGIIYEGIVPAQDYTNLKRKLGSKIEAGKVYMITTEERIEGGSIHHFGRIVKGGDLLEGIEKILLGIQKKKIRIIGPVKVYIK